MERHRTLPVQIVKVEVFFINQDKFPIINSAREMINGLDAWCNYE
jgi:hypothetical protein